MKLNFRIKLKVFKEFIVQPDNLVSSILFSAAFLFVFQWLFALDQVVDAYQKLGLVELPKFLIDGFFNFLRFALDDYEPTALLTISILLGVTLAVLRQIIELEQKSSSRWSKLRSTFAIALVGSGCASCSSSILSPVLSGLSVTVASNVANAVSFISLTVALILAGRSFSQSLAVLATSQAEQGIV